MPNIINPFEVYSFTTDTVGDYVKIVTGHNDSDQKLTFSKVEVYASTSSASTVAATPVVPVEYSLKNRSVLVDAAWPVWNEVCSGVNGNCHDYVCYHVENTDLVSPDIITTQSVDNKFCPKLFNKDGSYNKVECMACVSQGTKCAEQNTDAERAICKQGCEFTAEPLELVWGNKGADYRGNANTTRSGQTC